jgi:hypothetical protein
MAGGTTAAVVKTIGLRRMVRWGVISMAVLAVPAFFAGFLFVTLFSTPAGAAEPEGDREHFPGRLGGAPARRLRDHERLRYRADVKPHDHFGIDLASSCGDTVRAASTGVVTFSGWTTGGWGNRIIIAHADGSKTGYAHMQMGSLLVRVGDAVEAGQPIGLEETPVSAPAATCTSKPSSTVFASTPSRSCPSAASPSKRGIPCPTSAPTSTLLAPGAAGHRLLRPRHGTRPRVPGTDHRDRRARVPRDFPGPGARLGRKNIVTVFIATAALGAVSGIFAWFISFDFGF